MAESGPTSVESDCSLWSRSSESQTPVAALHRWQLNYKYSEIRTIYTFPPILLQLLPSWLVVMLTLSLAGSFSLS